MSHCGDNDSDDDFKMDEEIQEDKNCVRMYCNNKDCSGEIIQVTPLEGTELECPVCYAYLDRVAMLSPCCHTFCSSCISSWHTNGKGCPMCRNVIVTVFYLNRPVANLIGCDINFKNHFLCSIGETYIKKYVMLLGKEWHELVRFMFETHSGDKQYTGVKGTEILNVTGYDTVKITKTCLVYKKRDQGSANKKVNFLVCAYFPNLAIRLKIVARNRARSINPDNEYADQFVRDLNEQMRACWRVTSQLFTQTERLYVREFEKITCSLLLTGYQEKDTSSHNRLMGEKFAKLENLNFDLSYHGKIRSSFPNLIMTQLTMAQGYMESCSCQR